MTTIKEAAESYEPKKTLNIADLESFDISEKIEDREGETDGKTFTYKVLVRDGEEYRIPETVLGTIKGLLEANAKLKKEVSIFSVTKTGEGLRTKYQVATL